jgi:hypothetical protein
MQNILWLDDHFDELIDASASKISGDVNLASDYYRVSRELQDINIIEKTNPRSFIQQIIDHDRIFHEIEPRNRGACRLNGVIIDIFMKNSSKVPIPKISDETGTIMYSASGLVEVWETLKFRDEGFDAGLRMATHVIARLSSFKDVSVVFYTFRPITKEIEDAVNGIKNCKIVGAHQKLKGIEKVLSVLKRGGF